MKNLTIADVKRLAGKEGYSNNDFANWLIGIMVESSFYNKNKGHLNYAKDLQIHSAKLYDALNLLGYYDDLNNEEV